MISPINPPHLDYMPLVANVEWSGGVGCYWFMRADGLAGLSFVSDVYLDPIVTDIRSAMCI